LEELVHENEVGEAALAEERLEGGIGEEAQTDVCGLEDVDESH